MKLKDLLGDKWPRRLSVSDAYSIGGPAQGFNRAYDLFCNLEIDLSELIDEGKLKHNIENCRYAIGGILDSLSMVDFDNTLVRAIQINHYKEQNKEMFKGLAKTIKTGDIWKEIKE